MVYFRYSKTKGGVEDMSARSEKKKLTFEDKFARRFYCQHARLNFVRNDKKQATSKMRKINKKMCETYWQLATDVL